MEMESFQVVESMHEHINAVNSTNSILTLAETTMDMELEYEQQQQDEDDGGGGGFDDEDKLDIIEFYRANTLLWDPSNPDHRNNEVRRHVIRQLAHALSVKNPPRHVSGSHVFYKFL